MAKAASGVSRPGIRAMPAPHIEAAERKQSHSGVFMAVAMLALLFVWQSSGRLAPPPPAPQADADAVTGRAAGSALSDLLRRHLRAHELPAACVLAWGRTAALPRALLERHLERLHDRVRAYRAAPRRQRDAVACYRDLCEIIAKKEAPPCKTPPPA